MTHVTIERAKLEQVLEALENHEGNYKLGKAGAERNEAAITTTKEALAQPAPVQIQKSCKLCTHEQRDYLDMTGPCKTCRFYSNFASVTPPAAQRKPLTYEQITDISKKVAEGGPENSIDRFVRAIEAAHGITKGQP
jgi:hypothetical protein